MKKQLIIKKFKQGTFINYEIKYNISLYFFSKPGISEIVDIDKDLFPNIILKLRIKIIFLFLS